ncbi:VIT1/CCC1 transporter family protein [soil metagenome]
MPRKHVEKHFSGSEILRDVVIGMSDGLTVPFALAAGLSGAVAASRLVVTAGMAEITAGAIAMGLGGYLAARGEIEHFDSERGREMMEVKKVPRLEEREIIDIFAGYGVAAEDVAPLVASLRKRPDAWVDFMMRFELGLARPNPRRAITSALTIGGAYVAGGLVPLIPYIVLAEARRALYFSAAMTVAALFVFGFVKSRIAGQPALRGAFQTALIGTIAATAAFALAHLFA